MSQKENKRTIGEELFLVHLSRNGDKAHLEDLDREAQGPRKDPEVSVGEELWRVHCKRCAGTDREDDDEKDAGIPEKKVKEEGMETDHQVLSPSRTIHLRSRDVEVPSGSAKG